MLLWSANRGKRYLRPGLIAFVILVLVALAGCPNFPRPSQSYPLPSSLGPAAGQVPPEFQRVLEVWQLLSREHVDRDKLDAEALSSAAIKGMLQALGDPYASFLTPEQRRIEEQGLKGSFEGIGAEVTIRNGQLTVVSPLPGTPAERAGIRPGDVILAVDGESTRGMTLLEAVIKIRGPKGTPVRLLIQHLGEAEPVEMEIIRDEIEIKTVRWRRLSEDIGYIRITSFAENTGEALIQALKALKEGGTKGLVLDLRNNPGGLLSVTVDIASQFLREGLVVYEIDGRGQRREWQVKPGGMATEIPMVVLVNGFSASGSEVLAGSLQDHGRATIMGTPTFGKGSVNVLRTLSDGSGLFFTYARWYTPKGRLIEDRGLTPDIQVPPAPEREEDIQLQRAVEYLKAQIQGGLEK